MGKTVRLCHTAAFMTRLVFYLFFSLFIVGGRLQGQRADIRDRKMNRMECERHKNK